MAETLVQIERPPRADLDRSWVHPNQPEDDINSPEARIRYVIPDALKRASRVVEIRIPRNDAEEVTWWEVLEDR